MVHIDIVDMLKIIVHSKHMNVFCCQTIKVCLLNEARYSKHAVPMPIVFR